MSASTDEWIHPPEWSMLEQAGLRQDPTSSVWLTTASAQGPDLQADPAAETYDDGSDCSPLLAMHLAALSGPVLVVEAAPAVLITALTNSAREVVILTADAERAARLARRHIRADAVAVVLGSPDDLVHGLTFGTVIALDLSSTDIDLLTDLRTLLTPDGRLASTSSNRSELISGLSAAGLPHQEWMLLLPDPAMPTLLLSSAAPDHHPQLDTQALLAGHLTTDQQEKWLSGALLDNAPGYLVVAGSRAEASDPVLARFTGSHRRARFRVATRIEHTADGLVVRRARLHPLLPGSSGPLVQELVDEPYLPGRAWSTVLDEIVGVAGWTVADIAAWFRRWADELTLAAGPDEHLAGKFLDAIPRNLLIHDDHGHFVDLEWTWTDVLLRRTVVFRALLHSLSALVNPAPPDPSVPIVLGDLILQVAEQAGEPLGDPGIEHGWQFESTLQNIVSGARTAPDHLKRVLVLPDVPTGPPTASRVESLRVALAGVEADNDALRADIDSLLADLDRNKVSEERWETAHELLRTERDAIAAHRDAVVADRELVRDELRREIEAQRQITVDQHHKLVDLTAELDRAGRTATAHRYARAQAAIIDYERELRDRRQAGREDKLLAQVRSHRRLAVAAESARTAEAHRADRANAALDATLARVSWRVTRPLRAIRRHQLKALSWWRLRGAASSDGAPSGKLSPAKTPKAHRRRARKGSPRQAGDRSETALVDLNYYRSRYADLAHLSDAGLGTHFDSYGRHEGRMAVSWLHSSLILPPSEPDERETILLVLADAGRGDAPALALSLIQQLSERYHVVAVLLAGGELAGAIIEASGTAVILNQDRAIGGEEARVLADDLRQEFKPAFAVINSVASHEAAVGLEQADVPVVALINELVTSVPSSRSLLQFFRTASEVIYPAEFVASSMADLLGESRGRGHTIAPPGRVTLRAQRYSGHIRLGDPEVAMDEFLTSLDPSDVLIVGIGAFCRSKGADLFLEAAEHTASEIDGRRVRFLWVDDGLERDVDYRSEVFDQYRLLPAETPVSFASPSEKLENLYRRADLMFLSSRLDLFPTAAIDAVREGIPVVCFDGASSFADWLLALPTGKAAAWVVPNLDSAMAAKALSDLVSDSSRPRVDENLLKTAAADFHMNRYADVVEQLGRRARLLRDKQEDSLRTILFPDGFDVVHYTGGQRADRGEYFAREYLRLVRAGAPLSRPRNGVIIPRPRPGFHPLVYAESAPGFHDDGSDPLTHFLRAGRPAGRWSKRIILPQVASDPGRALTGDLPTVLVHGHFHYPELLLPFLDLLATNQSPRTLVITTTSNTTVAHVRAICGEHPAGFDAEVVLVSNRGRNLSSLFSGPVPERMLDHELVLHVHGKRSPHAHTDIGNRWREYLWRCLLGQLDGFGDQIIEEFARSARLGLVAPEDRHLHDWDLNGLHAKDLLRRLGRTMPLPTHFDFPLGAMFWARTAALRPFLDAKLTEDDYPAEPLPLDGTSLHAMERLIPLVIEHDGYEYAKTYRPDLHR